MTEKRLFDYDPLTGVTEHHIYDEDGDKTIIQHQQDVTATLDRNKARQNDDREKSDHWELMADIPVGIVYEFLTKHGVDIFNKNHLPAVKRLLNSNEYRYLRVNHMIM